MSLRFVVIVAAIAFSACSDSFAARPGSALWLLMRQEPQKPTCGATPNPRQCAIDSEFYTVQKMLTATYSTESERKAAIREINRRLDWIITLRNKEQP